MTKIGNADYNTYFYRCMDLCATVHERVQPMTTRKERALAWLGLEQGGGVGTGQTACKALSSFVSRDLVSGSDLKHAAGLWVRGALG